MKRNSSIFMLLVLAAGLLAACEETVDLDIDQAPARFVIDARVTSEMSTHYVRLSRSVDLYQTGQTPRVTDATVTITNLTTATSYAFLHAPAVPGTYRSEAAFATQPGEAYRLEVIIGSETFTATDSVFALGELLDAGCQIDEDNPFNDEDDEGYIYQLLVSAEELPEENFYQFEFFRNDTIQNFDGSDVFAVRDVILGDIIRDLASPEYYAALDTATFKMYSVSSEVYNYLSDLDELLGSDGGMFSPPPANPRSNIRRLGETEPTQDVFGVFQASFLRDTTVVIAGPGTVCQQAD